MRSTSSHIRAGATVWVAAGAPGAGKTTVASLLARRLDPAPAVLDKDTLYGGFVAATLAAAGRQYGEREGPWYDEHVKVHEYAGLAHAAREIRRFGCQVVLVAPFTGQIRDPAQWADYVTRLGGEPTRLVWVRCDETTLRERIVGRGHARDAAKLADFATFVATTLPDVPPPVPHYEIDNRANARPLADQVRRLVVLR